MNILIVAATPFEVAPLLDYLENNWNKKSFSKFVFQDHMVDILVTGVGGIHTTFSLARYQQIEEIDLAINVGIAGSFTKDLSLGSVVEIIKDRFADIGVEEKDGYFTDVFEMELVDQNRYPYDKGWIQNTPELTLNYVKVNGLTVNKVHGNQISIDHIMSKYNAHVETMEGAAFFYSCQMLSVKSHQIRAISNFVEPRNKANWEIPLAIDNVNHAAINLLKVLL